LLASALASTLWLPLQLGLSVLLLSSQPVLAQNSCRDLFSAASARQARPLQSAELSKEAAEKIMAVPEFQFIRKAAEERGIRVWLFGGTAASYLHYVKWDLLRRNGVLNLQAERFDYDYTNIFRSTQDLDIVVDATPENAREFERLLKQRFPHFLGSKENKWEVRSLKHATGRPGEMGYKEALLNDLDFSLQNTDSNSVAMVEITRVTSEPAVRDLKSWNDPKGPSQFLSDTLNNEVTYFRSPRHFETARARLGENPEILSVIRVLVKAFQYELTLSPKSEAAIKAVIQDFNPKAITNEAALKRIKDTSEKLIKHAVNLEYAINKLDDLGLREKLISMGNSSQIGSFAWWLNKEPLRSKPIGRGAGPTAKELGIEIVAHETNTFLAYESITRAHSGEPNVLISRSGFIGEGAADGDGFYNRIGKKGAKGTGLTIRFRLNSASREGKDADFTRRDDHIVIHNKKALEVIPESIEINLQDLFEIARGDREFKVEHSDLALIEKLRRRVKSSNLQEELLRLFPSRSNSDLQGLAEAVALLFGFGPGERTVEALIGPETRSEILNWLLKRLDLKSSLGEEQYFLERFRSRSLLRDTKSRIKSADTETLALSLRALITESIPESIRQVAVSTLMAADATLTRSMVKRLSLGSRVKLETAIEIWANSNLYHAIEYRRFNDKIWSEINELRHSRYLVEPSHLAFSRLSDPRFDFDYHPREGLADPRIPVLQQVVRNAREDVLKILIEDFGADPSWQNKFTGISLLHEAVLQRNSEIVGYLLSLSNINVNATDSSGRTPIFYLNPHAPEVITRIFRDSRVDPSIRDHAGQTWLHALIDTEQVDSIWRLASAQKSDLDANIRNRDGDTILLSLLRHHDFSRFDLFDSNFKKFFSLMRMPLDPFIRNKDGFTALEVAYMKNPNSRVVQELIQQQVLWTRAKLGLKSDEKINEIRDQITADLQRKFGRP